MGWFVHGAGDSLDPWSPRSPGVGQRVVLTALEGYVGMPRTVLSFLALVALTCGAYSICCYYLLRKEWRPWLRAISSLNLAYCGVTAALVVAFWARLTFLGATY